MLGIMIGLLSACQAEPAPETDLAIKSSSTPVAMAANGSGPGTYVITAADGSVTSTTLNANGTYVTAGSDGEITNEGTFAVVNGKTCFAPSAVGSSSLCYTETTPGPDGSFSATGDDGTKVRIAPAPIQ